jgi:glycerol-3-phosphate dehydrogenase
MPTPPRFAPPDDSDPLPWCALDRDATLDQARSLDFELIIIGGGITGAGLAREAALRHIPFLLVDQDDFAAGTSSRSSKMAHGGFRYLAQGEYGLVREAAIERNWLRQALPNLVRPLAFHFCARAGGDSPARVRAGIRLYDLLSNAFSRYRNLPHRFLSAAELAEREPAFATDGILMAGLYYDALVDDARLALETLKEARDASGGRSVALNHVRAEAVTRLGRCPEGSWRLAVDLRDRLGGSQFTVRAPCVVNATGAWTSETLRRAGLTRGIAARLVRPTKGVHLVVPNARLGNRAAFVLKSKDDGRNFFVLRRGDVSMIGTTDTDYRGDLDAPWCERQDCDYLLRTVNRAFPAARLTADDLISTSAGIRPLVRAGQGGASSVSRRHTVLDCGQGLVTVVGGKLTTFRPMAWEVLERCADLGYLRWGQGREGRRGWFRGSGRNFSRRPYRTGVAWEPWLRLAAERGLAGLLPEATLRHLHQQYGRQALAILREVRRNPAAGVPLLPGQPFCPAEIGHILAFENAPRLADVMLRRTEMQLLVPFGLQPALAERVAGIMACRYAWSPLKAREELDRYLAHVRHTIIG